MEAQPKARKLKVIGIKDYPKPMKPKINIEGKWLMDAGIPPETYVIITNPFPGTITIERINEDE